MLVPVEYSAILRAVPDTVFVVDGATRILFVNHLLPGYSEAEVLGAPAAGYVHPDHRADFAARLAHVLATGETDAFDIRSQGAVPSEYRWYHFRMRRVSVEPAAAVVTSTDITERKRLEAQREALLADLRRALDRLEALEGLVPQCVNCARVRLPDGRWTEAAPAAGDLSAEPARCPDCGGAPTSVGAPR